MLCEPTRIPEVLLLKSDLHKDVRGFFAETFRITEMAAVGVPTEFVQENLSGSTKDVLRGMHYQIEQPQGKLVRVTQGEVFDVAVDLRRSSPTFGMWVGQLLNAESIWQMWIPEGFAHGFLVLSDWAEIEYKVTQYYSPEGDRCLLWDDPAIGIEWPLEPGTQPILSDKDTHGTPFDQAETFE